VDTGDKRGHVWFWFRSSLPAEPQDSANF